MRVTNQAITDDRLESGFLLVVRLYSCQEWGSNLSVVVLFLGNTAQVSPITAHLIYIDSRILELITCQDSFLKTLASWHRFLRRRPSACPWTRRWRRTSRTSDIAPMTSSRHRPRCPTLRSSATVRLNAKADGKQIRLPEIWSKRRAREVV